MANLPPSLSLNVPFGGGPNASNPSAAAAGAGANKDRKMASAEHLVLDLSNPDLRENALLELSKVTFMYIILIRWSKAKALILIISIFFMLCIVVSWHWKIRVLLELNKVLCVYARTKGLFFLFIFIYF